MSSGGGSIEVKLSPVEKQRQAQGHAHHERGQNRQPAAVELNPGALHDNKRSEGHGGQDDVHAEERADAVNRAQMLVRALLEPTLPSAECPDAAPVAPIVLERSCRGLRVRMVVGQAATEDDSLEIAPVGL